ncbi:hypothetical protein BHO_0900023 (plasmid) [Borrelia hermsii YBT]|nr:hypothetical protein BHO_0900023 [Borrelia hermsii YBT]
MGCSGPWVCTGGPRGLQGLAEENTGRTEIGAREEMEEFSL